MNSFIPCSKNCIYQIDGYCNYENNEITNLIFKNSCFYFVEKNDKNKTKIHKINKNL